MKILLTLLIYICVCITVTLVKSSNRTLLPSLSKLTELGIKLDKDKLWARIKSVGLVLNR